MGDFKNNVQSSSGKLNIEGVFNEKLLPNGKRENGTPFLWQIELDKEMHVQINKSQTSRNY